MRKILFQNLLKGPLTEPAPRADDPDLLALAGQLQEKIDAGFGGSLAIRAVDAGSCNACELELHALGNPYYDLERFGLKFVASPRHADVLLVTGPVTKNMREALQRTFDATPAPKWVIAAGDCACDGGMFAGSPACLGGVEKLIPVDLALPGCPPTPLALLKALLALANRR
jgi:Ni,Fe-hydrogenase III small subunit